jgi:hypothetical protein
MARPPKPTFWKRRDACFVTIDGTRHFLATDKEAALNRFHQLMAEPQKRIVRSPPSSIFLGFVVRLLSCFRCPGCFGYA